MSSTDSQDSSNTPTEQKAGIQTFVKNVIDGEYAQANNELAKTISNKIKNKIKQVHTNKIFKNNE
tara:strand:- start:134 stop:328 length:195 start_codon:yes stop_codon:yes gene_type:complete